MVPDPTDAGRPARSGYPCGHAWQDTIVFQLVLKSGIPSFGFFLLSGLLVWNAFAGAVCAAAGRVSHEGGSMPASAGTGGSGCTGSPAESAVTTVRPPC